jgi:hypothetical protein
MRQWLCPIDQDELDLSQRAFSRDAIGGLLHRIGTAPVQNTNGAGLIAAVTGRGGARRPARR